MSRLELGLARVEFCAVKEDAARLLGQGHMYAKVYAMLKKQNKITMSYAAFYYYARQECPVLRKKRKEQSAAKLKQEVNAKQSSALTASVAPAIPVAKTVPERTGPRIVGNSSPTKKFGKNDFDFDDMTSVDKKKE